MKDLAVETIEQFYCTAYPEQKFDLLVRLLEREKPSQAIIFCRTKRGTEKIHRRLAHRFKGVDTIHGDLAQSARDRAMRMFRGGEIRWLVATDVVGRGIDVTGISHIINYDIPQFCDDYVHRVGRTGRMGREGVAYTFVTPEEGNELTRIEMRINRLLIRDEMAGAGMVTPEKPAATGEPPPRGRTTARSRRRRSRRRSRFSAVRCGGSEGRCRASAFGAKPQAAWAPLSRRTAAATPPPREPPGSPGETSPSKDNGARPPLPGTNGSPWPTSGSICRPVLADVDGRLVVGHGRHAGVAARPGEMSSVYSS